MNNDILLEETTTDSCKQFEFAQSKDFLVRAALARNPALTPEAQLVLVKDETYHVLYSLSKNAVLTPEAQLVLAKNDDQTIRWNLARSEILTDEAQLLLADEFLIQNPGQKTKAYLQMKKVIEK